MKNKDFKDLLAGRVFKFDPIIVKNIRKRFHASQVEFARMIGISVDTLQNWEQGRRRPEGPAMALLKVAEAAPDTVMKALNS